MQGYCNSTPTISFYHVKELKWQRKGTTTIKDIGDYILNRGDDLYCRYYDMNRTLTLPLYFCLIIVLAMCNNLVY